MKPRLTAIHLVRKSLDGTVAANALKHGTGSLNIGGTRIGSETVQINTWDDGAKPFGGGAGHPFTGRESSGRWPANLILQHKAECEQVGTKKVKGSNDTTGVWGNANTTVYEGGWNDPDQQRQSHTAKDGTETVDAWACVQGCPVADLDEQSGHVGAHQTGKDNIAKEAHPNHNLYEGLRQRRKPFDHGDKGGASRFFKQVQADE